LSGGQKQRLSIIRALAHEPALFILDEPVANLDPLGRREFLNELINGVIDRDTTVVFSTHILSDLERVAMDVAFLRDGQLGLQGEIDQLLETVFKVEGSASAVQHLRAQLQVQQHDHSKSNQPAEIEQLYVDTSAEHLLLKMRVEVAQGLQLSHTELSIKTMNLEDLFIEVTK
jgi:ABC-2 type transport system ATP-binding protein